jgi:hypothetical protein
MTGLGLLLWALLGVARAACDPGRGAAACVTGLAERDPHTQAWRPVSATTPQAVVLRRRELLLLARGDALSVGDRVRTGLDAKVHLATPCGALDVYPGSEVVIEAADASASCRFIQSLGRVYYRAREALRVETIHARAAVRGTRLLVEVHGSTRVSVDERVVRVSDERGNAAVKLTGCGFLALGTCDQVVVSGSRVGGVRAWGRRALKDDLRDSWLRGYPSWGVGALAGGGLRGAEAQGGGRLTALHRTGRWGLGGDVALLNRAGDGGSRLAETVFAGRLLDDDFGFLGLGLVASQPLGTRLDPADLGVVYTMRGASRYARNLAVFADVRVGATIRPDLRFLGEAMAGYGVVF